MGFVSEMGISFLNEYEFIHSGVVGEYYYRLKQTDYDGVYDYSVIRFVSILDDSNPVVVKYNNISFSEEIISYKIYDMKGEIVDEGLTDNRVVDISNYIPGIYIVKALNSDGDVIVSKVNKY